MPSATLALMMARSGNMHTAPTSPVKVIRLLYLRVPAVRTKLVIVAHAHSGPQGSDRAVAGAARGLPVAERGRRHHLRRQGTGAARSCPQLSGRLGTQPAA